MPAWPPFIYLCATAAPTAFGPKFGVPRHTGPATGCGAGAGPRGWGRPGRKHGAGGSVASARRAFPLKFRRRPRRRRAGPARACPVGAPGARKPPVLWSAAACTRETKTAASTRRRCRRRRSRRVAETHPFSSPSDSTFILICESDTVNRSTWVRADKF